MNDKLVIFDLDGTLIDSAHDIKDSINAMLVKFGYRERTLEDIKRFIGNGAKNLVKKSIGVQISDSELEERLSFYNRLYTESGSPKTRLYGGVKEVLEELKNRGYKIALLTNKPQMTTDDVYKTYLKDFRFDSVVGQREGFKKKPDPETTVNMMKALSVRPENVFFVGDGETDVMTAINAGVKGIAVLWGYRDKARLEEAGAVRFAYKPSDLLDIINYRK